MTDPMARAAASLDALPETEHIDCYAASIWHTATAELADELRILRGSEDMRVVALTAERDRLFGAVSRLSGELTRLLIGLRQRNLTQVVLPDGPAEVVTEALAALDRLAADRADRVGLGGPGAYDKPATVAASPAK